MTWIVTLDSLIRIENAFHLRWGWDVGGILNERKTSATSSAAAAAQQMTCAHERARDYVGQETRCRQKEGRQRIYWARYKSRQVQGFPLILTVFYSNVMSTTLWNYRILWQLVIVTLLGSPNTVTISGNHCIAIYSQESRYCLRVTSFVTRK